MIVTRHIISAVLGLALAGVPFHVSFDPQVGISIEYQPAFAKSGKGKDGDGGGDDDSDDDDDDSSGGGSNSGKKRDTDVRRSKPIANLHLRYTNGWDERIRDGRYRLVDPQGRTVSDRRATEDDLSRMRAITGR